MRTVRILIVGISGILYDILSDAIASRSDMRLVGSAGDRFSDSIERHEPDVIITGDEALAGEANVGRLLLRRPRLRIAVIYGGGETARLFELRETTLIDPSPTMLLEAIGASAAVR